MNAKSNRRVIFTVALRAALLVTVIASATYAQSAGVVATLDGTVEIGRGGSWAPAVIGSTVEVGDTIRTGKPGRVRIAFRDDSVVNVGDDSQLAIDENIFNPDGGEVRSVLELLSGKVRAIVSEHYREPRATYEIRTVTAVSGVRGTDFIMAHDPDSRMTRVVGVSGLVDVNGSVDRNRNGVVVGAQEITEIEEGGFPTPPRRIDETLFRQYLDGLEFIGFGIPESLLFENPIAGGGHIPPADRVDSQAIGDVAAGEIPIGKAAAGPAEPPWEMPDVSQSVGQPPGVVEGGEVGIEF